MKNKLSATTGIKSKTRDITNHKAKAETRTKTIIRNVVTEVLEKNPKIRFAYFFGSFVAEKKYLDIDIGIYLAALPTGNPFTFTSDLKHKISRKLLKNKIYLGADNIDIVILNLIPFTFLYRIFKEGSLILDRDPDLRAGVIEENSLKFRECLGLLKEAQIL